MVPMYFGSKSTLPRFELFEVDEGLRKIDKTIAKAALQKISQHLWYLTDEVSVLSLFDDDMDQETKVKMVENVSIHGKRYIPSKEELCSPLYGKSDNQNQSLFDRLKIDDSLLHEYPTMWSSNASFRRFRRKKVSTLRAVNDADDRAVKLMQDFHGLITV
ncbi:hypothetical protein J437_LFUL003698 [Ladona fulva]|uniref:Uncharacterized protein n=1 Tax=Ladona fulva TaxID=123851 RepID=A0A8K0JXN7_LADFU|nr:hypothetical protein J437_LFUL003698 [Ladona fulva]